MTSLPIRLSTNFMTFIPNLTFTELWVVSMEHLQRVWLASRERLPFRDTWFRPHFRDLLMLQLLRPNSSNLPCLYSTFHIEYPLVLSRFCFFFLVLITNQKINNHVSIIRWGRGEVGGSTIPLRKLHVKNRFDRYSKFKKNSIWPCDALFLK